MRLLAPHTLQEELKLDVEALRSSPVRPLPLLGDRRWLWVGRGALVLPAARKLCNPACSAPVSSLLAEPRY